MRKKLERYDDNLPRFVALRKIIVQTEYDKQQILLASEYIHGLVELDTDYNAVNVIAHIYEHPEWIEVIEKKE